MVCTVTVNGLDLRFAAYVDTAAAKSVAGRKEADASVAECKLRGWPFVFVDEHEPFRFGPLDAYGQERLWLWSWFGLRSL